MMTLFWSGKTIEGRSFRESTMVQVTQLTARNFEFHIRHRLRVAFIFTHPSREYNRKTPVDRVFP